MKKFNFALAAAVVGLAAFPMASEAADATGTATASVVAPIAITQAANLSFGTIAPTGTAGTVTIATGGARTSTNVDLFTSGAGSAGQFNVTGEGTSTFSTTIPGINLVSGSDTMAATFTNDAPSALTGGAATINVGGELAVGAAQPTGSYTGTFTVTVAYN